MANPNNTNQSQMRNQPNQGQYGAGGLYGNPGQIGPMGNQGQYGYTGYPGMANQGQWGMQGQQGQMGQPGNQGMYGTPSQMGQATAVNVPTTGPHSGHGPQNYQRSDQRINEDVCDRLTAHGYLDARHIDVKVNNGEVTLSGTVDSRQDKREAENVADSVQGVKDVQNQLKVQRPQGQSGQQSRQSGHQPPQGW